MAKSHSRGLKTFVACKFLKFKVHLFLTIVPYKLLLGKIRVIY